MTWARPSSETSPARKRAGRRVKQQAKGTNALTGSAKGRRSIADRPKGVYACWPYDGVHGEAVPDLNTFAGGAAETLTQLGAQAKAGRMP